MKVKDLFALFLKMEDDQRESFVKMVEEINKAARRSDTKRLKEIQLEISEQVHTSTGLKIVIASFLYECEHEVILPPEIQMSIHHYLLGQNP
jgi:hypothetical protein